ncbi:MAG: ABC transporter substrate-binding protein [Ramlibacter sp.]
MKHWKMFPRWVACSAFVFAQAAAATEIVVGQVAPLTGMDANQGRAYSAGLQLVFSQINKAGGVAGHTFTLVRKDDGGRPQDTVAATQKLVSEVRPMVLAGYSGGRNIAELLASKILQNEKIALVGYRTGEITVDAPYLYSVRAGVRDEINKIANHLATVGITRLGLFYEDGPNASSLLNAMDEVAVRTGAQILAKASYAAGTAGADRAAAAMVAAKPQAVLMVATGAATASFVELYREGGGTAQLFSHSGADIEQMGKRLSEEQLQGIAIAQVTPNPYRVTNRLTKDFADALARSEGPEVPVSYAMMEGYIAAKVIVEATRRMGTRSSREAFVQALESMGPLDLGGYTVEFGPNKKAGSRFVEMSIVTSGRIRQ